MAFIHHDTPLFSHHATTPKQRVRPDGQILKRIADLVLTGVGLLMLAPLFIAVALAIKINSPGPVFFKQERVGYRGNRFGMLKFRSMYIDAEERRAALLAESDRDGVCFKHRNDPRVTPIGRILRRYSIDELPQLLNVITGEMSLVGPRPALPEEVAAYSPRALQRLNATPGLTGIWQVAGRADIDFDRMVEMDIAYGNAQSLGLDLMLLALTVRAVVSGRGAY